MELLSPAGNIEKLQYAYEYGADAAYIGLKRFSLRVKADNFYDNEYEKIVQLKRLYPNKKLYCALNISFHNRDIQHFLDEIDYFKSYPIDAFIVQDIGIVPILQKHFPHAALHLSTQANCINKEAVKMYQNMGFSRVVLGREASLAEIREIKDAVPSMELEVFAHGAMCVAYSGRCLMSAYMTARSANGGFCSHSCRWEYRLGANPEIIKDGLIKNNATISQSAIKELAQSGALFLEEHERPGEFFPVFEGDNFTAILSSKDICMVDHLDDMKKAGIDSLKIEGRMKSVYYVAMVTRAYRKALDVLEGKISQEEANPFINELYKAAHREFATGFYYKREDADKTTVGSSESEYEMVGTITEVLSCEQEQKVFEFIKTEKAKYDKKLSEMHPVKREAILSDAAKKIDFLTEAKEGYHFYRFNSLNKFDAGTVLEYVEPNILATEDSDYVLISPNDGSVMNWVCHGHDCLIYSSKKIALNSIVRAKAEAVKK